MKYAFVGKNLLHCIIVYGKIYNSMYNLVHIYCFLSIFVWKFRLIALEFLMCAFSSLALISLSYGVS